MATTFVQKGNILTFTAPTGGVASGVPVLIGGLFVIPTSAAVAAATFQGDIVGVWSLTKNSGETWTEGEAVYWDLANLRGTTDSSAGLPIGVAADTGGSGSSAVVAPVRLNGTSLSGRLIEQRFRRTITQVNAGTTLVPAIPGIKIRLVEASAIAIGGAVTSVTTVDILGTLTSSRKLVAFAQASLTQSTQLKSGGTGAAILADGASFTANDANTAITANITGSAITVATNIDFDLKYALE